MQAIDIFIKNLLRHIDQEAKPSMLQLSLSIGASPSYIQKVSTNNLHPSFPKIDEICRYYDVRGWEMFCDMDEDSDLVSTIQMLETMPADTFPLIYEYVKYLNKRYGDGAGKRGKKRKKSFWKMR
ncbi:MAG: hypothetical protein LUC32_02340 [Clostridiales bacterium]|nr:hypothetical protein [Lachnospiraceae bacterium]MCD8323785.1 hypothetical protein [Clostridiales bacterium]